MIRELKVMGEFRRVEGFLVDGTRFLNRVETRRFFNGTEMQVYQDIYDSDTLYIADNKTTHEVVSIAKIEFDMYLLDLMKEMEVE